MKPLELDVTRQEELYRRACARVAGLVPGWSDQYPSDPAVAMLELVSYLSDIQNHAIDQVGREHALAYLKLLGETPRELVPARLLARPLAGQGLYAGMRFWVGGVPFEAAEGRWDGGNHVADAAWGPVGAAAPPGQEGQEGFSVSFWRPLPAGRPFRLWLELSPEPGRTPPDEETPPPVRLRAWTGDGGPWREAGCRDGTRGLLQSGCVTVTPPAQADRLCLLPEGEPEGTPRLSDAVLEPILLEQRCTRSRCVELAPPFVLPEAWAREDTLRFFVPEGTGWREAALRVADGQVTGWRGDAPPRLRAVAAQADFSAVHTLHGLAAQRVALDEKGVLPRSLEGMVEEDGLWYDCPVGAPEERRTLPRGCRWDEEAGALCFGDGRDFCVPRPGRLLVTGCVCCLGSAGNGAGGVLERDGVRLRAIRPAQGGQDRERPEEAVRRAAAEQGRPLRAVTCGDYETLARQTPGLALDRVRAVTDRALGRPGAGVTVVAKPRADGARPTLTRYQAARLRQWLEPFRLLGVTLRVKGPRYCPLSVRVRVQADETLDIPALRAAALALTDGVEGPLDFGAEVSCAALFSALGAVPGVRRVRWLELEALSQGGQRTPEGDVRLEADVLPCLEHFQVTEE